MSRLGDQRRLREFGDALAAALAAREWTQRQLGDALGGITQSAVSAWKSGLAEPAPTTVFAMEDALDLAPGTLSRHLGYLPIGAKAPGDRRASRGPMPSFEDAVEADGTLRPAQKNALLSVYRSFRNPS